MPRPEKYSSHDEESTIAEIRRYRIEGHGDKEIRRFLNNMPERTFYDYVKKMYAKNAEIAKELREHDKEILREQVEIYKNRANELIKKLNIIINGAEDERTRVDAAKAADQIALNIVTIQYEKPQIIGELIDDISNKSRFNSQKAEPTSK